MTSFEIITGKTFSFANVTALLVNYSWNGFGISEEIWTIVMISAGTIIVALTVYRLINPFVGLSVIWAFTGIILKRHEDYRSIATAALVAIFIVTVVTVYRFLRHDPGV